MHPDKLTFIDGVFLNEIDVQAQEALAAMRYVQVALAASSPHSVFLGLDSFLDRVARLSLLLWPDRRGNVERGKRLRNLLSMSSESSLRDRTLRNCIMHFDERLDRWAEDSPSIYFDKNIGPPSSITVDGKVPQYLRHYDPVEKSYQFMGENFRIAPIEASLLIVLQRVRVIRVEHACQIVVPSTKSSTAEA